MKQMKTEEIVRYSVLGFFLVLFSVFSLRHFVLGGGVAASVDALCPFGGFETLFTFIATGGFVPRILMSSLILGIGILVTVLVFRKGFCGYICPFGTLQELLGRIMKKKFVVPKKIDQYLRYLKYVVLAAILVGTAYFGILVFRAYDPFMTFFHFGKGIFWDVSYAESAEHLIPFVILMLTLFFSVFIERFWCKYLCPLGAVMNIFTWMGITKITRDSKTCTNCKLCDRVCPMNVKVSNVKTVKDVECINCNKCVNICSKSESLSLKTFGKSYSVITYIVLMLALFFLVIGASKAFGIWQSIPAASLVDVGGDLNGDNIKGWMTLNEVAIESKIHVQHFVQDLGLPAGVDLDLPLKDMSKTYGIEFETQELRDYVSTFVHAHQTESEDVYQEHEVACPWGLREEPYPGTCALYVDTDRNGLCDLSE